MMRPIEYGNGPDVPQSGTACARTAPPGRAQTPTPRFGLQPRMVLLSLLRPIDRVVLRRAKPAPDQAHGDQEHENGGCNLQIGGHRNLRRTVLRRIDLGTVSAFTNPIRPFSATDIIPTQHRRNTDVAYAALTEASC